ncbi:hypothetical protein DICVIV_07650 [Dictyocaulus viviparus]|uniref:Uncharacterized protein n=1 Tax=Dictyocaulus viviparus TaxID=29172 RepID=A0A0D8XNR0_DICVI|nr:hypothetical protein DICVIV_07650 [Dictyocaulus viviparus]
MLYGKKTVKIIEPIQGVKVADVVWNELYQDMMDRLSESDRQSVRSLNSPPESARQQDTRSLRSLNLIGEGNVEEIARDLSSCHLSSISTAKVDDVHQQQEAPIQMSSFTLASTSAFPKTVLRDKSKSRKRKRWRLSFNKDVT